MLGAACVCACPTQSEIKTQVLAIASGTCKWDHSKEDVKAAIFNRHPNAAAADRLRDMAITEAVRNDATATQMTAMQAAMAQMALTMKRIAAKLEPENDYRRRKFVRAYRNELVDDNNQLRRPLPTVGKKATAANTPSRAASAPVHRTSSSALTADGSMDDDPDWEFPDGEDDPDFDQEDDYEDDSEVGSDEEELMAELNSLGRADSVMSMAPTQRIDSTHTIEDESPEDNTNTSSSSSSSGSGSSGSGGRADTDGGDADMWEDDKVAKKSNARKRNVKTPNPMATPRKALEDISNRTPAAASNTATPATRRGAIPPLFSLSTQGVRCKQINRSAQHSDRRPLQFIMDEADDETSASSPPPSTTLPAESARCTPTQSISLSAPTQEMDDADDVPAERTSESPVNPPVSTSKKRAASTAGRPLGAQDKSPRKRTARSLSKVIAEEDKQAAAVALSQMEKEAEAEAGDATDDDRALLQPKKDRRGAAPVSRLLNNLPTTSVPGSAQEAHTDVYAELEERNANPPPRTRSRKEKEEGRLQYNKR